MLCSNPSLRCERGFSLVELLVAVLLVAVLLTGALVVLGRTRASYETTASSAEWTERAQLALDLLSRDTRAAGFNGCNKPAGDALTVIQVFAGESAEAASIRSKSHVLSKDSDVLALQVPRANTTPIALLTQVDGQSSPLEVDANAARALAVGDTFMLYNCSHRAYGHVTDIRGGRIEHDQLIVDGSNSSTNSDQALFAAKDEMVVFDTITYYVQQTPDSRSAALWRSVNTHASPLLRNVERLRVKPGQDRRPRYAGMISVPVPWNETRIIDISITVTESAELSGDNPSSTPKVLTTTVCIRNRCLPDSSI